MSAYVDKPLRTRERAALDAARATLRQIAQHGGQRGGEECSDVAVVALERIHAILGEK